MRRKSLRASKSLSFSSPSLCFHVNERTQTYIDLFHIKTINPEHSILVKSEWKVVITTKGEFDAIWVDRQDHKMTKHRPQNHVITWFVKGVDNNTIAPSLFNE